MNEKILNGNSFTALWNGNSGLYHQIWSSKKQHILKGLKNPIEIISGRVKSRKHLG